MPITDSKPTSDNPQTQAPQNVQYAAPNPYPQQFEDDTIDLYELWITLWNKKVTRYCGDRYHGTGICGLCSCNIRHVHFYRS